MTTANDTPAPMIPPVFSDYDTWTAFASLAPCAKDGTRAVVDVHDRVWLQNPDGSRSFPMTPDEALELTAFLCERFGLVVLNEPEAFGNDAQPCECERVPERVKCVDCEGEVWTTLASGRAHWNPTRAKLVGAKR